MSRPSPSEADLLADMRAVYQDLGYLTVSAYDTYGLHKVKTVKTRFGSWEQACLKAGIAMGRKKRATETVARVCRNCQHVFQRPKADPSCAICTHCRHHRHHEPAFNEDFLYVG